MYTRLNPDRTAVLPSLERGIPDRTNDDYGRLCGLSSEERQALSDRARARGMDSLILLCEERGVPTLDHLLV